MGITSFILGVVSLILSFLPFTHFFAIVPAIIGLIMGITDLVYNRKNTEHKKGLSISGVVLSFVSLMFGIMWTIIILVSVI